jgi:hypothetical protein
LWRCRGPAARCRIARDIALATIDPRRDDAQPPLTGAVFVDPKRAEWTHEVDWSLPTKWTFSCNDSELYTRAERVRHLSQRRLAQ